MIVLFCLFVFTTAVFPDSQKTTIYFYTSETNINNFASLKMEFDRYLAQFGAYEFQPFKDRWAFETRIKKAGGGLVVLSSWHYREIHKTVNLKPVLIGLRDGRKSQKRILVVPNGQTSLSAAIDSVSSAADEQLTRDLCEKMMTPPLLDPNGGLRILAVPKDIDALMSVGFGISKAALTTENAFHKLSLVNPALHRKMKILIQGQDTYLPVVAVLSKGSENVYRLLNIIEKMPQDEDGRNRIGMLGLDGWHKVDPADEKKLELNNCQSGTKAK